MLSAIIMYIEIQIYSPLHTFIYLISILFVHCVIHMYAHIYTIFYIYTYTGKAPIDSQPIDEEEEEEGVQVMSVCERL